MGAITIFRKYRRKKAVYDAGLTSWMIWDPSNRYTVGALDKE